jgi:hypothetical protein
VEIHDASSFVVRWMWTPTLSSWLLSLSNKLTVLFSMQDSDGIVSAGLTHSPAKATSTPTSSPMIMLAIIIMVETRNDVMLYPDRRPDRINAKMRCPTADGTDEEWVASG